ncbi:MAG TPA: hypothetical protein VGH64_13630 [Puia sp.]
MKVNIIRLSLLAFCLCFLNALPAQDSNAVLRDSAIKTSNNKNANYLKDTSILKKDTLKRPVPTAAADTTAPAPSHFQANLTWQSNDVNNGRKDSSVIPLITPEISYLFKSGFEIDLSVGYNTHEASPQVNQYTLDGSYSFNPGNYSGSVTVNAFFYSKNSGSTTSEQKGSLVYDNSYSFSFIQPSLDLTWTVGNHLPDYQASFALQHEFDIGNLSITPTATMNASTQNSYNSYYQNRRFSIPRNDGKPPLPFNVTVSGEVLNADKFQILDYEFSAPISYTAGNWTFNFTPTEALPVNPADIKATLTVDTSSKSYTYKEKLPNTFYFSLEVTYAFNRK